MSYCTCDDTETKTESVVFSSPNALKSTDSNVKFRKFSREMPPDPTMRAAAL